MAKLQVVSLVAVLIVLLADSMYAYTQGQAYQPQGQYQSQGGYQEQGQGYQQQGYQGYRAGGRYRREINPNSPNNNNGQWDPKAHGTGKASDSFTPVTGPKSFKFNVADGIQGANQQRQETWDKGAVQGMYSHPVGDGKWQIVNYVADDKGFRVISTKIVDEADVPASGGKKANVDIENNGEKTSWTVNADELGKKSKDNNVVKQRRDNKDKDSKSKDSKSKWDGSDKKNEKDDKDSKEKDD